LLTKKLIQNGDILHFVNCMFEMY